MYISSAVNIGKEEWMLDSLFLFNIIQPVFKMTYLSSPDISFLAGIARCFRFILYIPCLDWSQIQHSPKILCFFSWEIVFEGYSLHAKNAHYCSVGSLFLGLFSGQLEDNSWCYTLISKFKFSTNIYYYLTSSGLYLYFLFYTKNSHY